MTGATEYADEKVGLLEDVKASIVTDKVDEPVRDELHSSEFTPQLSISEIDSKRSQGSDKSNLFLLCWRISSALHRVVEQWRQGKQCIQYEVVSG